MTVRNKHTNNIYRVFIKHIPKTINGYTFHYPYAKLVGDITYLVQYTKLTQDHIILKP